MTPSFRSVRPLITKHRRVAARMDYVSTDGHVFVRTMFGSSSAYKVFFLEGGGNSGQNTLKCQWKERDGSSYATRMFVGPHCVSFISVSESSAEKERYFHRKSGYKKSHLRPCLFRGRFRHYSGSNPSIHGIMWQKWKAALGNSFSKTTWLEETTLEFFRSEGFLVEAKRLKKY